MKLYLDTSVIASLLAPDKFSAQADALIRQNPSGVLVSDFAATEYASVVARLVRTGERTKPEARTLFSDLDMWLQVVERVSAAQSGNSCRLDIRAKHGVGRGREDPGLRFAPSELRRWARSALLMRGREAESGVSAEPQLRLVSDRSRASMASISR